MIEFIRWQIRLRLAGLHERLRYDLRRAAVASHDDSTFERLVSRVSPWRTPGYERVRLRRALYRLRYPRSFFVREARWQFVRLLDRLTSVPVLGRFEGMDYPTRLKVEWLTDHSEMTVNETGDTEEFGMFAMQYDLDPPWSRDPEFWIVFISRQGFVEGAQYDSLDDADAAFTKFEDEYDQSFEPFEDDLNFEGDPTRNGAFG